MAVYTHAVDSAQSYLAESLKILGVHASELSTDQKVQLVIKLMDVMNRDEQIYANILAKHDYEQLIDLLTAESLIE